MIRHSDYIRMLMNRGIGDVDYYAYMAACTGVLPDCAPGDIACINAKDDIVNACSTQATAALRYGPASSLPSQLIPGTSAYNTAVANAGGSAADYNTVPGAYTPSAGIPASSPTNTGGYTGGGYRVASFSGPQGNVSVGQGWQINVTGASPNSVVQISASQNGKSLGTTSFGTTDGNGNFSLSGAFDNSTIGNWTETVMVGGQVVGTMSFNVGQPASQTPTQNPTGSGTANTTNQQSGATGGTVYTAANGQTTPSSNNFLSGDINLFGHPIPTLEVVAGVGVLVVAMMMMKGRR